MKKLLLLLLTLMSLNLYGQPDTAFFKRFQTFTGVTISPQLVFLGALDAGPFVNLEYRPFRTNNLSLYAGLDARNKWLHLRGQSIGYNTNGLRTFYSINLLAPLGAGYSFINERKRKSNSFYVLATPTLFTYKERVNTLYFENLVSRSTTYMMYGLAWSTTSTNKRGRVVNYQFYIPIFSRHMLENLRNMNIKFGWGLFRK